MLIRQTIKILVNVQYWTSISNDVVLSDIAKRHSTTQNHNLFLFHDIFIYKYLNSLNVFNKMSVY